MWNTARSNARNCYIELQNLSVIQDRVLKDEEGKRVTVETMKKVVEMDSKLKREWKLCDEEEQYWRVELDQLLTAKRIKDVAAQRALRASETLEAAAARQGQHRAHMQSARASETREAAAERQGQNRAHMQSERASETPKATATPQGHDRAHKQSVRESEAAAHRVWTEEAVVALFRERLTNGLKFVRKFHEEMTNDVLKKRCDRTLSNDPDVFPDELETAREFRRRLQVSSKTVVCACCACYVLTEESSWHKLREIPNLHLLHARESSKVCAECPKWYENTSYSSKYPRHSQCTIDFDGRKYCLLDAVKEWTAGNRKDYINLRAHVLDVTE